jgi:hypothetical protein
VFICFDGTGDIDGMPIVRPPPNPDPVTVTRDSISGGVGHPHGSSVDNDDLASDVMVDPPVSASVVYGDLLLNGTPPVLVPPPLNSPKIVITTAHCVHWYKDNVAATNNILFLLLKEIGSSLLKERLALPFEQIGATTRKQRLDVPKSK